MRFRLVIPLVWDKVGTPRSLLMNHGKETRGGNRPRRFEVRHGEMAIGTMLAATSWPPLKRIMRPAKSTMIIEIRKSESGCTKRKAAAGSGLIEKEPIFVRHRFPPSESRAQ